jgi:hypothetical protein
MRGAKGGRHEAIGRQSERNACDSTGGPRGTRRRRVESLVDEAALVREGVEAVCGARWSTREGKEANRKMREETERGETFRAEAYAFVYATIKSASANTPATHVIPRPAGIRVTWPSRHVRLRKQET